MFVVRVGFGASDVVAGMKRMSVVCYIGELICWMAMWEPGCLAGRMVLERLASLFSCVAVKEAGTEACFLAKGWV